MNDEPYEHADAFEREHGHEAATRAAILEYEAGFPRHVAERRAVEMKNQQIKEKQKQ